MQTSKNERGEFQRHTEYYAYHGEDKVITKQPLHFEYRFAIARSLSSSHSCIVLFFNRFCFCGTDLHSIRSTLRWILYLSIIKFTHKFNVY